MANFSTRSSAFGAVFRFLAEHPNDGRVVGIEQYRHVSGKRHYKVAEVLASEVSHAHVSRETSHRKDAATAIRNALESNENAYVRISPSSGSYIVSTINRGF